MLDFVGMAGSHFSATSQLLAVSLIFRRPMLLSHPGRLFYFITSICASPKSLASLNVPGGKLGISCFPYLLTMCRIYPVDFDELHAHVQGPTHAGFKLLL